MTKPILVGGPAALAPAVEKEVAKTTGAEPLRLWGTEIIDTQVAIFEYGQANNLWGSDCLIAQGIKSFADALSFSPLAYKMKAPIFLANADGLLPETSQKALKSGKFTRALIGGGTSVVSEKTVSVVKSLLNTNKSTQSVIRLGGQTLYDTSSIIAQWAVKNDILNWDKAAFATGEGATDSLAGSAVQARDESVLLLIDDNHCTTLDLLASHKSQVNQIKFFGGQYVVSIQTRDKVTDTLGFARSPLSKQLDQSTYTYENITLSLREFAQMEVGYKVNSDGSRCSVEDILEYLDPTLYDNTTSQFMEFVDIGRGYSGISAETIDAFIAERCVYSERAYGFTSNLRGMGSVIVEAAQTYNINEAYLLAHAIIESAWGCSYLSQGLIKQDGEWVDCGYLNFFGIGAFDSDPQNGASMGAYYGWDSPRSALLGGAYWISKYYIHSGNAISGSQNTLWKMAWDTKAAIKDGNLSRSHQYATGRTWAISIALVMDNLYTKHMGRYFDFDELGITSIVPVFKK